MVSRLYWWAFGITLVLAVAIVSWMQKRGAETQLLRTEADQVVNHADTLRLALAMAPSLYRQNCAACHGDTLHGNRGRGIPDLTDSDWLYGTGRVSQIERIILFGIRSGNSKGWNLADMPAYARAQPYSRYAISPLTPQNIRDLVEYLLAPHGRGTDTAAATRGAAIFAGAGACYDCHSADARGDSAIGAPNLVDTIWLYGDGSPPSVFESIAYGHHGSCPAWVERLRPVEARALAVYVYLASHPGTAKMVH